MTPPTEKKPLLTRNELLITIVVAVIALAFAFLPVFECPACGPSLAAAKANLEQLRKRRAPAGVISILEGNIQDWSCGVCRGVGRASLLDRLLKGAPPPPGKKTP